MRGLLASALGAFVALAGSQAHAAGPSVGDAPSFGSVDAPGVRSDGGWFLACLFASSPTCSDSRVVTTTRAGTATCLDATTAAANTACITANGIESFPSGSNGRTASDVHTVSTTGWPGSSGEIWLTYTPASTTLTGVAAYLFDSRVDSATATGLALRRTATALVVTSNSGSASSAFSFTLTWTTAATRLGVLWGGGRLRVIKDGVVVIDQTGANMPTGHRATATIGSSPHLSGHAEGSIVNFLVNAP